MKKAFVLLLAMTFAFSSQAQIGKLVGGAVKKKLELSVEKKVDEALNLKKKSTDNDDLAKHQEEKEMDKDHVPTPEEVMAMVPQLPSQQQLAEYACEQNRANPRTLKMLANPTTAFLAQMVSATASSYVVMMNAGKDGSVYTFDEQLLKEFGLTEEAYEAMSEEEQQELAVKYAGELQDRFLRTAEFLADDKEYNAMMEKYTAIENEIGKGYDEADSLCRNLWETTFGKKEKPTENDMCEYFQKAVPIQYKAVIAAMKTRKSKQLTMAKEIDTYVQKLAKEYPSKVYASFYNQGGLCAASYISDAARLTALSDPR